MLVYDTLEQARMRLRNSVLTYLGQACYVRDVVDARGLKPMMVHLTMYPLNTNPADDEEGEEVLKQQKLTVPLNDPDLNFRIFNVGYINDVQYKQAHFLTRGTVRQQVQGLTPRALFTGNGRIDDRLSGSKEFEDMLFKRYPTPEEAFQRLTEEGWNSVAIGQHIAVGRDRDHKSLFKLFYRNQAVGIALGKKFSSFTLEEEYTFLKEVLQEEGVPFTLEDAA